MNEDRIGTLVLSLLLVALIAALILVLLQPARATEYSQIDYTHIEYCDEYARRSSPTVAGAVQAYGDCIRILPTRLPMPEPQGTVPATENPRDEEWRRQCRAEYVSWDEETGTVVRRGNPERVKCPCGDEVQCQPTGD